MFYYLNGILAKVGVNTAVIDCGGVGYLCNVSDLTEAKLADCEGKTVKLFTHLSVREDAMEIFGFFDGEEMGIFKMLISVSGIGAKTAIGILGKITPERFAIAVSTGDIKGLKVPGVGPKMAARIILELKDKIAKESAETPESADEALSRLKTAGLSDKLTESRTALMALGYSKSEAEGFLKKINCEKLTVEEIIREALKRV